MAERNFEHDLNASLEKALPLIRTAVAPAQLTTVQEAVFSKSWSGSTYQDIAESLGYDEIYIRGIGAQLWQHLSKLVGKRVNKSNVRAVINELVAEGQSSQCTTTVDALSCSGKVVHSPAEHETYRQKLEDYVERPPIEASCYEMLAQQGALIRIKAPKQMGKTALMTQVLTHAKQHHHTVVVSLRLADSSVFTDLDRLLMWFCAIVSDQLNIEVDLEEQWKPFLGSNYNCTQFFDRTLLPQLTAPVVIALDDVDVLFDYAAIATDFLGLLRAWCEQAKRSDGGSDSWHRLKLMVIHSTEVYIPLHQHQSPFNVGLSIELSDFTREQVKQLASMHGIEWNSKKISEVMALVGGKPQLIRLTLDSCTRGSTKLQDLLQNTTEKNSIYAEHLRQQFRMLQKYPDLIPILKKVMVSDQAVALPPVQAFQLESLGLVTLQGQEASPSCSLYRQYFSELLQSI